MRDSWLNRRFSELAQLHDYARGASMGLGPALTRYIRLAGLAHYSPVEIFGLGLLDRDGLLSPATFPSKQETLEAQLAINPRAHFAYTEDKLTFARHCASHHLPSPHIRVAIVPDEATNSGPIPTIRNAIQLPMLMALDPPSELVLKPVAGVHGEGIQLVHCENGRFSTIAGNEVSIASLMALHPHYGSWLLQERVHPHRELQRLAASPYLMTVRAVTVVDHHGSASLPIAWLRIIASGNICDNFNFGSSGNLVATLDIWSGRLDHVLGPAANARGGLTVVICHPETEASFADFRLPFVAEMRDLVLRAAYAFAPLRTVGWDVAITDDGPCLIEGNVTWDPLPTKRDLREIVAALNQ